MQNYLVYANSILFIANGGDSRIAGFLLAMATTAVWVSGPAMIGYIPVCLVGALIFLLGIELIEEAVWDTFGKCHRLEYLTIISNGQQLTSEFARAFQCSRVKWPRVGGEPFAPIFPEDVPVGKHAELLEEIRDSIPTFMAGEFLRICCPNMDRWGYYGPDPWYPVHGPGWEKYDGQF